MPDGINRRRLARLLALPADADDAQIARAIRRLARKYRSYGRPFVLPRDLGLRECLAAVELRMADELAFRHRLDQRWMETKQRFDEEERQLNIRLMGLNALRLARDAPEETGTEEQGQPEDRNTL